MATPEDDGVDDLAAAVQAHLHLDEAAPTVVPSKEPKPKEKKKKSPKPGSKAAVLLKQQQRQQAQAPPPTVLVPYTPPEVSRDLPTRTLILSFRTPKDLASALLRPHLTYEGTVLNGPLLGVNFPSAHLRDWAETTTPTEDERSILSLAESSSYIIAHIARDRSTLLHEWAHAVYYTHQAYRDECLRLWNDLPGQIKKAVNVQLGLMGYREDVWMDEWQAYCVEGPTAFGAMCDRSLGVPCRDLKEALGTPPGW
ncbi:hypothetical protein HKX48_007189 [Thoreauomyces humboldtii]|nr:hypothetical protein HKX48_007189 [Thoreauomyces humboldtii]